MRTLRSIPPHNLVLSVRMNAHPTFDPPHNLALPVRMNAHPTGSIPPHNLALPVRMNAHPTVDPPHILALPVRMNAHHPPHNLVLSVRMNAHPTGGRDAMMKMANPRGVPQTRVSPDCANNTQYGCENRPHFEYDAPKTAVARGHARAAQHGSTADGPLALCAKTGT